MYAIASESDDTFAEQHCQLNMMHPVLMLMDTIIYFRQPPHGL